MGINLFQFETVYALPVIMVTTKEVNCNAKFWLWYLHTTDYYNLLFKWWSLCKHHVELSNYNVHVCVHVYSSLHLQYIWWYGVMTAV